MIYEKELVINGTKYIRADNAVNYVRALEEKAGERILKSPIEEIYQMTQDEFYNVSDIFESGIVDRKFIEIENATIHVLNEKQFSLINKIINCYYNSAYSRLDNALEELESIEGEEEI